jgi:hypothetical protein
MPTAPSNRRAPAADSPGGGLPSDRLSKPARRRTSGSFKPRNDPGPGRISPGRTRGSKNLINRTIQELIREALDQVGGSRYVAEVARKRPDVYLSILGRLIPTELKAELDRPVMVVVKTGIPGAPGEDAGG